MEDKNSRSSQKFSGTKPNIYWKSINKEDVKRLYPSRYITLQDEPTNDSSTQEVETDKTVDTLIETFSAISISTSEQSVTIIEQGTEAWLALRKGKITASILSNLLGFFEPKSAKILKLASFYIGHEKVKQTIQFLRNEVDQAVNASEDVQLKMNWGKEHELNAVATLLKQLKNVQIKEASFYLLQQLPSICTEHKDTNPYYMANWKKEFPQIGASPDGFLLEKSLDSETYTITHLLEIKCPSPFMLKNEKNSDNSTPNYMYLVREPHKEIPLYYLPQIQCQLMCAQHIAPVKKTYYVCWTATKGTNMFEVEYDEQYCAKMLLLLQFVCEEYVLREREVEQDFLIDHPLYKDFLQHTISMQQKSKLIQTLESSCKESGGMVPLFCD